MSAITYRGAVLFAEFSDSRPRAVVHQPLSYHECRELAALVERHGGISVESSSRRMIAFFARPPEALAQARAALQRIRELQSKEPLRQNLGARVLLSFGAATLQKGRLHSDWTARLPDLAAQVPANAIAATPEFTRQFPAGSLTGASRLGTELTLLDGAEPAPRPAPPEPSAAGLERGQFTAIYLTRRGERRVYRPADCPLPVGREASCTLQLAGDNTSRVHGRIEFIHGKFHYIDDSRNGTYVLTASGEEVHVRGEKIVLIGEGAISPGAPLKDQTGEVLRYSCNATWPATEDEETGPLDDR
jgi:hypothetical protein